MAEKDSTHHDASADDWPWPPGEMVVARFLVQQLIEWEPDSPLNAVRQRVLDCWPRVRPVF